MKSETDFIRVFSGWLNPDKPSVVLCRNVVDIMRLRIFFHEKIENKTLFNVHFMTMDQWINKILPAQSVSKKIIHGKLAEKALIFQKLTELYEFNGGQNIANPSYKQDGKTSDTSKAIGFSNSFLDELLKLPAFKNEILYLWHLYIWNRQIQPRTFETSTKENLSSELFFLFNDIYESMAKNKLLSLPDFFSSSSLFESDGEKPIERPPNETGTIGIEQVICLFPTDYNVIEKIKMKFLFERFNCIWKFVFINDHRKNNLFIDKHIKLSTALPENSEFHIISNFENAKQTSSEWMKLNRIFFANECKNKEMKIWMCKNTHDEYQLVAGSIRTLYDRGVPLHGIFILYCTTTELPLLEYYLKNHGLSLNYPEKYSSSTRSVISIATDLIDLLGLRNTDQSGAHISRNQFIELLQNPVFFVRDLCDTDDSRKKLIRFLYDNYDMATPVSLDSMQRNLRGAVKYEHINLFLKTILDDRKRLLKKALPSIHSLFFMEIFKKYLAQSFLPGEHFDIQINAIEKTIGSFPNLDRYFQEGMEAGLYYSLLYDELSQLKLKTPLFKGDLAGLIELPEVYARNIQEAVHSPVDYLFICNLTSKAFPATDRHPDFLDAAGEEIKFALNLDSDDQKKKIRDSLSMVRKGYCMTFNIQQDSAPSEFIFEQIPNETGKMMKKEKLISELPFYERQAKKPFFEPARNINDKILHQNFEYEVIRGLNQYPESGFRNFITGVASENSEIFDNFLNRSFYSKFLYNDGKDKAPANLYQKYTGLANPVKSQKTGSSGSVENFAWCPQLFWFEKVLALSPGTNFYEERYVERRHMGTLFHDSAKNLINSLREKYPETEYGKILKYVNQNSMERFLKDSFKIAEENFLKTNKTDFNIFTEGVLQNSFEQFGDYFNRFFYLAEKEKHPLYDYYPLAVELSFENIALGPFFFKGRIDRIDYQKEKKLACVVDYKTGTAKNMSYNALDMTTLEKFQLPLYLKAVGDVIKQNSGIWPVTVENIQGAYEFTGDEKKSKTTYFMEIEDKKTIYEINSIANELESLLENGLNVLEEVLSSGYFFAFGHKKTPDGEWETKCRYCDYATICDRAPYGVMIRRLNSNSISNKFLNALHPK